MRRYQDEPGVVEIPLLGGDVTEGIVRAGNTVRRPMSPSSTAIHALLDHLAAVGFAGAPQFLGVDDQGREVLTFLDGEVAGRPRPAWIADEDRLLSVARLLRDLHAATSTFRVPEGAQFVRDIRESPEMPPVPDHPDELVGHCDITPENVIFDQQGEATALIDFDMAFHTTRADEVYNALLYWGPLAEPGDRDPLLVDVDVPRRCRAFADEYGLGEFDRSRFVGLAQLRSQRTWFLMKDRAERIGGGWATMWADGVGDIIHRRQDWLQVQGPAIEAALLA